MKMFTKLCLICASVLIMVTAISFSWAIYEDQHTVAGVKIGLDSLLILAAGFCSFMLIHFNWPKW